MALCAPVKSTMINCMEMICLEVKISVFDCTCQSDITNLILMTDEWMMHQLLISQTVPASHLDLIYHLHGSITLCWLRAHTVWPTILCGIISMQCTPSNILHCLLELCVRSSFPLFHCVNIYSPTSSVDMSPHQSALLLFSAGHVHVWFQLQPAHWTCSVSHNWLVMFYLILLRRPLSCCKNLYIPLLNWIRAACQLKYILINILYMCQPPPSWPGLSWASTV